MSQPGFNGTIQIVDVAANGGLTPILATGPVRYVEIFESTLTKEGGANVPQGLDYQLPNDGFSQWIPTLAPTAATDVDGPAAITIGDQQARHSRFGILLGNGADTPGAGTPPIPATVLCNLRSATSTATAVVVKQYY